VVFVFVWCGSMRGRNHVGPKEYIILTINLRQKLLSPRDFTLKAKPSIAFLNRRQTSVKGECELANLTDIFHREAQAGNSHKFA